MLALATRTIATTALYYGYSPNDPGEELFVMSVIALGMSTGSSAKTAAYAELSQLTQLLVRNGPWAKLNEKVFTKIVRSFAAKFAQQLPKKKLGAVRSHRRYGRRRGAELPAHRPNRCCGG